MLESPGDITDEELQDLIDLYDAEIRFTDHEIGRLIDEVKSSWGTDTVVLITSDHGEQFREHGEFSHSTVHDEGIHVPLIIDDRDGSGEYEEIVGLLDVAPTIADYADCNIPENFYGHSLRSLIENNEWKREYVIGDWGGSQGEPDRFFYRDPNWKYIRNQETEELYRLNDDPGERENIVDQDLPILSEIRSKIEDHRESIAGTSMDIDNVEMDDVVKDRLEKLGYR